MSLSAEPGPLAVITGASSGIGEHIARLVAARGYRTVLIARRTGQLEALAQQLTEHAPSYALTLDLADAESIEPAAAALLRRHGPVDLLVNNAGVGHYEPFVGHSMVDHHRLMQVNYFAAAALVRAVLPGMLRRGRGQVINVASMAAKMGPWGHAGYAASKAALVSLTQTLAAEYGSRSLHFSYVNPGIVRSAYFEQPSLAALRHVVARHGVSPAWAARRIVHLLDRPRLELTLPGHYRAMDWLIALSPTWAHRLVARSSRPRPMAPAVKPAATVAKPAAHYSGGK